MHRSDFTAQTQQVRALSPYWRGRITFAPMNDETMISRWRSFLANIASNPDPTFWVPYYDMRRKNGTQDFKQVAEVSERLELRLFEAPAATGTPIQVRSIGYPSISVLRLITAHTNDTITLNLTLPLGMPEPLEYDIQAPHIRALATNNDLLGGALDPASFVRPNVIAWTEATGTVNQEIADAVAEPVPAQQNFIITEDGLFALTTEDGDNLVWETHGPITDDCRILTEDGDFLMTEGGEFLTYA